MPIRVLIVDDSTLMRRALTTLLASDSDIEVVGTARDGRAAIEQVAALRPDVITMDVRMPVMDGLETTEHIMAYYPTPILVLTASLSRFDIDITFKMLGLGALDVMEKPSSDEPGGLDHSRAELIRRVKVLSRVRVVTHLRGRRREPSERSAAPPASARVEQQAANERQAALQRDDLRLGRCARGSRPLGGTDVLRRMRAGSKPFSNADTLRRSRGPNLLEMTAPGGALPQSRTALGGATRLIVIGASTGGPRVVQQILRDLPVTLPAAVLVVQHIADGFTVGMVEWLAGSCMVPVHLAHGGAVALPGNVYVAPDNLHLIIDQDGILGVSSQPALLQRPSIDVTMQRAAEAYGSRVIGVLLTGMGRDGALGMAAIHRAAGQTIAQSGDTCVVYGMPRAAIEARVVQEVLPPEAIAGRLHMLVRDSLVKR